VISAFTLWIYRKNRIITFSILVFFITIAPVANIFVYIGATFAERFLYTPSFGFSILSGILLFFLVKRNNPGDTWTRLLARNSAYSLVLVGILIVYSVLFIHRNLDWKENLTLYSADVGNAENSARAHYNYGSELHIRGAQESSPETRTAILESAKYELKKAIKISPTYLDAYNNLGTVYEQLNDLDSSNYCYEKILGIDSSYQKSYFNLGLNFYKMAKYQESVFFIEKLVKYQPDNEKALYLLGSSLGNLGKFDSAIRYLEHCMAVNGRYIDAAVLLGKAYGIKGEVAKAIDLFVKVLPYAQDNYDIVSNLALSYQIQGKYENSIPLLQKCLHMKPNDPGIYKELIYSLEKTGKTQDALFYRQKLSELFKTSG
jgi:tetratricopeptide (TPR) repeat protein